MNASESEIRWWCSHVGFLCLISSKLLFHSNLLPINELVCHFYAHIHYYAFQTTSIWFFVSCFENISALQINLRCYSIIFTPVYQYFIPLLSFYYMQRKCWFIFTRLFHSSAIVDLFSPVYFIPLLSLIYFHPFIWIYYMRSTICRYNVELSSSGKQPLRLCSFDG